MVLQSHWRGGVAETAFFVNARRSHDPSDGRPLLMLWVNELRDSPRAHGPDDRHGGFPRRFHDRAVRGTGTMGRTVSQFGSNEHNLHYQTQYSIVQRMEQRNIAAG